MTYLATGTWPRLHYLSLVGNPFGPDGLQHLIKGDWPVLTSSHLGRKVSERPDSIALLGLDPDKVQELKRHVDGCDACLHRNVLQHVVGLWPKLEHVWIPTGRLDTFSNVYKCVLALLTALAIRKCDLLFLGFHVKS